ncbi:hypothetical protein ACIA5C_37350 [Actinoplanes sp. NPDC051343]|uniref:hypothetical protein n=1 Tax=Actinoplanes sp. NPDC051343 TaxID=3363906 RepID=UPI00378C0A6A
MLIASRGGRPLTTVTDGAAYLQLLALSGVGTVLIVRAFLGLAGYPQVGGASLHIAHVLWGGLLMLAGLLCALLFAGVGARAATAVLGGVGLGLFVDEVGKFITRRNDYFYRPAAAIIYLVFAALLVCASQLRRRRVVEDRHRLATAAQLASAGVTSGLTSRQRHAAEELLAGQEGEAAEAVRRLLSAAPHRGHSQRVQDLFDRTEAVARRLLDGRWFTPAVLGLFILSRVVVAVVFVSQALSQTTGHDLGSVAEPGAIAGGAVSRSVALACVVAGLLRRRADKRAAYGWFRVAVLVELLVSQIFNFTDSQFAAVGELPFNLLVLAVLSYHLRRPGI